ncbi:hypothetical protein F4861DRAFT_495172 [Xylaria intraflava]|nr:hypothetical protein F4861DRAFT_495172 [Xylaria intraflava]
MPAELLGPSNLLLGAGAPIVLLGRFSSRAETGASYEVDAFVSAVVVYLLSCLIVYRLYSILDSRPQ